MRLRRGAAVCIDYGPVAADLLPLRSSRTQAARRTSSITSSASATAPLTIRYPINDHRAVFNVKQWTGHRRRSKIVNGDPLLEAMARFHGLDDNVVHMLADCIEF